MTEDIGRKNTWRRVCSALSLVALGAALAVGLCFPVLGVMTGGTVRANVALALIVIAVLLDLAVLSSYGTSPRIQHVVHVAWLTVAAACLVFSEYIFSLDYPDSPKAADRVLGIVMYLLAFPAGNIGVGFLIVFDLLFPSHTSSEWWDLVIYWMVFLTTGYLQWFKLLPWLIEKWLARRTSQARVQ